LIQKKISNKFLEIKYATEVLKSCLQLY